MTQPRQKSPKLSPPAETFSPPRQQKSKSRQKESTPPPSSSSEPDSFPNSSDETSTPSSPSPSPSPSPSAKAPQSRRQRRRNILPTSSPLPPPLTTSPDALNISPSAIPLAIMPPPTRLLICSIGNPSPYTNTYHSTGHIILSLLPPLLPSHSSFQKSRSYGGGLLSTDSSSGSNWTFYQSPSYMNVSGPSIASAWKQFRKEHGGEGGKLVVVHDELELGLGEVNVKMGTASPRGHNGLKSIKGVIKEDWYRIGVGIGRPVGRGADEVAAYVLRKVGGRERGVIEGAVGRVWRELERLETS